MQAPVMIFTTSGFIPCFPQRGLSPNPTLAPASIRAWHSSTSAADERAAQKSGVQSLPLALLFSGRSGEAPARSSLSANSLLQCIHARLSGDTWTIDMMMMRRQVGGSWQLLPSHLCKGPTSILPPALGVVEDLWRQLVDPPLQSGD